MLCKASNPSLPLSPMANNPLLVLLLCMANNPLLVLLLYMANNPSLVLLLYMANNRFAFFAVQITSLYEVLLDMDTIYVMNYSSLSQTCTSRIVMMYT